MPDNDMVIGEIRGEVNALSSRVEETLGASRDTNKLIAELRDEVIRMNERKVDRKTCALAANKYVTKKEFRVVTGTLGAVGACLLWLKGLLS